MTKLHLIETGQGPDLLLLHGIGSSATAWQRQIERLSGRYRCIAPDLPGYGESPDASGDDLRSFAEDVVSSVAGRSLHIVGVSFGALVALGIARYFPERVRSLVLADATLGRAHLSPEELEKWLAMRQSIAHGLLARSEERAAEIAGPGASPEVVREIAAHMRRARPKGYLTAARVIATTDARSWLPDIPHRSLVLCGEEDGVTGMPVSQAIARALPHASFRTISAAGHAPHIEQPDAFAAAVGAFLQEEPA